METTRVMFKLLCAALVCGALANAVRGDVVFLWEPTEIEVGQETWITMSMITNPGYQSPAYPPGESGVSFIGVGFSPSDPELELIEGEWLGGFAYYDPTTGTGYSSLFILPESVYASYFGGAPLVIINDETPTETFRVKVRGSQLGSFFLDTTGGAGNPLYIEEETFRTLAIKDGARVKIDAVPEPGALSLLALGGLVLLRRR